MNNVDMQGAVAEEVNKRLGKATQDLVDKYARGEGGQETSADGPTGQAYKEKYLKEAARKKAAKGPAHDGEGREEAGPSADADEDDEPEDADHELRTLREQRLKQLQQQQRQKLENIGKGHGQYREIAQDEFLAEMTNSQLVICHFYHRDFPRCEIMNNHLQILAARHIETKFVKINAEKSPFFVDKLKIRTIPTLVLFFDGVAKDKVLGFEELSVGQPEGKEDEWPTVRLARLLASKGMIRKDLIVDEEAEIAEQQRAMLGMRRALMAQSLEDDDDELSD